MKNKIRTASVFFTLILCCPTASIAGNFNFETSTSNIIEKLSTAPIKPIKLRSSLSSIGPRKRSSAIEMRGLTRVKLNTSAVNFNTDNIIEEKVKVPVKQTQAHVNLKIEFEVNSYMIKASSYKVLAELSKALQSPALLNKSFLINGHTDSDGDPDYNLKLSLRRALSVKQYLLTQKDILPERLTVIGYGESIPLVKNNNRYNKQINRRVEIVTQ